VAFFAPPEFGENETDAVAVAPGANEVALSDPTEKLAASVPVTLNGGVSVTVKLLLFRIVTGKLTVEPTCAVPRTRGFGVPASVAVPIATV
jgi:hypothetical protein